MQLQDTPEPGPVVAVATNPIYILSWGDEATLCMVVESEKAHVARRCDNDMVNGTKLLNATGISRGKRDGILKHEGVRQVVSKGPINLKGIWIPYERAVAIAKQYNIYGVLFPLFEEDICRVLFHPNNLQRTRQVINQHLVQNPGYQKWLDMERQYIEDMGLKYEETLAPAAPYYHSQVRAEVLHAQQKQGLLDHGMVPRMSSRPFALQTPAPQGAHEPTCAQIRAQTQPQTQPDFYLPFVNQSSPPTRQFDLPSEDTELEFEYDWQSQYPDYPDFGPPSASAAYGSNAHPYPDEDEQVYHYLS